MNFRSVFDLSTDQCYWEIFEVEPRMLVQGEKAKQAVRWYGRLPLDRNIVNLIPARNPSTMTGRQIEREHGRIKTMIRDYIAGGGRRERVMREWGR